MNHFLKSVFRQISETNAWVDLNLLNIFEMNGSNAAQYLLQYLELLTNYEICLVI